MKFSIPTGLIAVSGALLLLMPATPAAAQAGYRDSNGTRWQPSFNRNGAVLRSRSATIYLGRNCDARSARYGRGRWQWANGGFWILFRSGRITFPRQEIRIENGGRCRA